MLKRKYARLCTLLLYLALFLIALMAVMYEIAGAESIIWGILGVAGPAVCVILMCIVRTQCLRCPNCGEGLAVPQWRAGKQYYCSSCGKPFVFDDEKNN